MNSSEPQPSHRSPVRRIASNYLYTPQGLLSHPLVEADDEGRICAVGQCAEPDRLPGVEFHAGILLPGLIDAHCHLELSCLRGQFPEGMGFARFLGMMHDARARFSPEERARAAAAADDELWREGVQGVGDVASGESAFGVKAQSRIAYRTFVEVFGLNAGSADRMRPLLRHPNTSLTPHAVYSVQDTLFRAVCAEGDAPLSIHFLESPAEAELFLNRGALWEWYLQLGVSCDFLFYGLPAERIVESIPRDRSVILVHDCCVTQMDIDLIMNHFRAPVWWCLCPRSNHFISRRLPPVDLLRRNGLNICLGTDSLASNARLSLLHEMQMLRGVPLCEVLKWATLNGAAALGMKNALGEVLPGRRCGLNLLSGIDYERMELTDQSRIRRII